MKCCLCLLLFSHLFLNTIAWNCEVIPGTLKQIDAGLGIVGGVNNDNEAFLFLGTRFEKIGSSLKHFTVGPAGELGANSSNNVFKFADGSFKEIPSIQLKQVDAGGDQIIVGVSPVEDVFCLIKDANNARPSGDAPWIQLAGKLKYYSCGPYSCWGVNGAGNVVIRRSVTGATCGSPGAFEAVDGALSMVEVASDGNVFGVDTQGSLFQRVGVTTSNPPGLRWTGFSICPNGHKHGSSVSLRCSAETLCSSPPPTLTWSSTPRIPLSESSRLQELILISDLNFTATHSQHRVTFTCTITYQLQDENKTAHNNIDLHVQYAPKISNSSSCIRTDVTVCFCEVDGNPSPELEWHLSGRPVTNSSNTFVSEERLSSTDLRSSITLHQSLTHTSTMQCVILFSVLIGVAGVALVR
ncbi:hypothetical protein QQF64_035538 [Cirrhinus molitorella]|uniref:Ig-like domain-containing protein n=1 Tax=Cirrhinus molitorella TaxID=172907 RepID=A0ABR3NG39_9TELE